MTFLGNIEGIESGRCRVDLLYLSKQDSQNVLVVLGVRAKKFDKMR